MAEASDLATAHAVPIAKASLFEVPQAGLFKLGMSLSTLSLERITIWPLVGSGTWQSHENDRVLAATADDTEKPVCLVVVRGPLARQFPQGKAPSPSPACGSTL